jgi:hypothetical protein
MHKTILQYSSGDFNGKFSGRYNFSKKAMNGWATKKWAKTSEYTPKIHFRSKVFTMFFSKS